MVPKNQILLCDCIGGMRRLPESSIPFSLASPPYDDIRRYGGPTFTWERFQEFAHELWRVTADGGAAAWVVQDQIQDGSETGTSFLHALWFQHIGFRLNTIHVVMIGQGFPHKGRSARQHHYAFILHKGKPRYLHIIRDKPNSNPGQRHKRIFRDRDGQIVQRRGHSNGVEGEFGPRGNPLPSSSKPPLAPMSPPRKLRGRPSSGFVAVVSIGNPSAVSRPGGTTAAASGPTCTRPISG